MERPLQSVRQAVERGALVEGLTTLLALWREAPRPELAERIDALRTALAQPELYDALRGGGDAAQQGWLEVARAHRPETLDPLLATIRDARAKAITERVRVLVGWPRDPKRDALVVDWLYEMPHRKTGPFWTQLLRLVVQLRDPRLAHRLEGVSNHMQRTWDSLVARRVRQRLFPIIEAQRAELCALAGDHAARPLGSGAKECLQSIDTVLAARCPARPSLDAALEQERALERQIFEEPHDIDLRAVYGDLLSARGHPRGELIALGMARRKRGSLSRADGKREKALMRELLPEIAGPLLRAIFRGETRLDCGFLDRVVVDSRTHPKAYADALGAPQWATVRDLVAPLEVILHESGRRSLERFTLAGQPDAEELGLLYQQEPHLPLQELTCAGYGSGLGLLLGRPEFLPRLEKLKLLHVDGAPETLLLAPLCAGLPSLSLTLSACQDWQVWLQSLIELPLVPYREVSLEASQRFHALMFTLRLNKGGRHLELRFGLPNDESSQQDALRAAAEALGQVPLAKRISTLVVRPQRRVRTVGLRSVLLVAMRRFAHAELAG